ncbi:MAG: hypothetical protein C5B53_02425 [Candidatus Melainabacteria bacterium]|nr:MAG: hypothetical protein C5B53_02425 [Candidatus Melainabacteria bacterium]
METAELRKYSGSKECKGKVKAASLAASVRFASFKPVKSTCEAEYALGKPQLIGFLSESGHMRMISNVVLST